MHGTAAIIGAGLIGRAWAMVFARAGWDVRLHDSEAAQLASARERIAESLDEQEGAGLVEHAPRCTDLESFAARLAGTAAGEGSRHSDVTQALAAALAAARPGDRILVFGSFHTAATALEQLSPG
jgi:dihydrofolate synthase/folylpolyglutamate synthase